MALLGFGSVLPIVYRAVVERRRWVSPNEFNETWAFCQVLPGANILNFAIVVGRRFRGPLGALAGALGMLAVPLAITIGMAALYGRFGDRPAVHGLLHGVAAAAAGLMLATALKMAGPLFADRRMMGLAFTALTFLAIVLWRLPLPLVFLVLAPVSIWLEARSRR
jgi:chromate transporter